MEKFQKKYRIPTARAEWWNYSNNGAYFITICTYRRTHYFGEIVNQRMIMSQLGKSAESCWHDIPNHFPYVQLGGFVVMPNHVHGIIIINKQFSPDSLETQDFSPHSLETQDFASLPVQKNKFGPQSQNLGSIVRGYKIGVKKLSKSAVLDFRWQARFHEHIIRNEAEYHRIQYYIATNPMNWKNDTFSKPE
ncbi:MAG: hypothetical protein IPM69_12130 [Ignavibacteria bacterium]|nr:hypothetical protein [Ignavibacteria bacterium]